MSEFLKSITNIVLIAGSGQNVGKSYLGEHIIKQLCKEYQITTLKISSHFHNPTDGVILLHSDDDYRIFKETISSSKKDSQRYLQAGAYNSYYAEVKSDKMQHFINELHLIIDISEIIIVESATFGNFINPNLAFYIDGEEITKCEWSFPYYHLISKNSKIENLPKRINFIQNQWHLEI